MITIALAISISDCTSANAQSASNDRQARRQWRNLATPAGTLMSPHFGATQGNKDWGNGVAGRANNQAASGNHQAQKSKMTPRTSMIPLFGAPKDYDERYESNLGDELGNTRFSKQTEGYSLTPNERLISPESATRAVDAWTDVNGSAGRSVKGGGRAQSKKFNVNAAVTSSALHDASQFGSFNNAHGADTGNSVYRSPW
ncbi:MULTISPECIES: hypothetical protein [unclassified Burkholderia]|uniref:hypothetical protein n=1 Tax=unclassified Burkholderia TaxID=2613784 RepID=UPI000F56DC63|nr:MULTISPECIES: hypothetical protein [unclassified Burkholderia]